LGLVTIGAMLWAGRSYAQAGADSAAEFRSVSRQLSEARLGGGDESNAQLEKAFAYLDSVTVSALNVSAQPDVEAANASHWGELQACQTWRRPRNLRNGH
jgi:hypothetical protein